MNVADIVHNTDEQLTAAGIDNPALDARILVAHALGLDRAQLVGQADRILTEKEQTEIATLVGRRAKREPVSRILGLREFWSLPFGVNEATLVPRPESETVVEAALKGIRHSGFGIQGKNPRMLDAECRILDLGTGTGCLLLAILHELPRATGLGIDIAPRAVEQAKENAERLGLTARAEFRMGDWVEGIDEQFDFIISNPPYITGDEISTLMPEVRDHDPWLALDGGKDGLEIYRRLIPQLPRLLKPKGFAVFEVGETQAATVRDIFVGAEFKNIAAHSDINGIERCITATR